ncbi:YoaK family protein [Methylobacterium sp. 092160098-2]|uniref:YoaK family protein n=1 Tax=Methylobacterium TaxID=407 RepID=UPI002381D137|nr:MULTISPECIES: YoaK family protein [Methylobacterium]MDE4916212.1 YoaK family protein [Methylobacterium sp. 092160098-2]MDH3029371.1 YoaK family protein [Methylobacterium fujisawaense]
MLVHEGETRSPAADRALALSLAGVAGALNTAGFYAVGLYASNMTGNVSAISDRTGTGDLVLAAQACLLVVLFVLGATTSTLMIRRRRRKAGPGAYAYSVCAEAFLLVAVGLLVLPLAEPVRSHTLVLGLSFILGLQNAAVTKISEARVRTTHVTGMITDIGIELARWLDRDASASDRLKPHDPVRLRLYLLTVGAFLGGGLVGVVAYRLVGVALLFAAAAVLACLALPALRR